MHAMHIIFLVHAVTIAMPSKLQPHSRWYKNGSAVMWLMMPIGSHLAARLCAWLYVGELNCDEKNNIIFLCSLIS